ncbi:MAG: 50S ribosomal protein L10 [Deltaproteobacteria bacterium]|nr:50S ribosomal protein L10 [Deltaproteobacteria bacterium]
MNRAQKKTTIEDLAEVLVKSEAVFVTDFKGLSVVTLNQLRTRIRQAGGKFRVSKNTLVRLAAGDGYAKAISFSLTGNNALAYTEKDPVILAKILTDFAKEEDKFKVKCGLLSERYLEPPDIKILAGLPSKEVLLAGFLGTLSAVPGSFVRVLAGVPQKFLRLLVAISEEKAKNAAV